MSVLLSWVVFVVTFAVCRYFYNRRPKSTVVLPPGPRGLPFIGNLHQISKNASVTFSKWAKQYGKLYIIHLGNKPTLVINDAIVMKQLFGLSAATGKFHSEIFNVVFGGPYGLTNTDGKTWYEQRVFFINALKNAGIGRTTKMQSLAIEGIEHIGDCMEKEMQQNGTVYLSNIFKRAVGDTLWTIMTEERDETNLSDLLDFYMASLDKVTNAGLAFFSWIKDIAPKASGYNNFVQRTGDVRDFLQRRFDDPRRVSGEHKDLIYRYMEHCKNMQDPQSSFFGEEGRAHSFSSVLSLLLAGTESTSTTMHYLMFYMTAHPDVQTKVQNEIDDIIGKDRDPTVEDRKRMPYMEAVIEETLRRSAAIPFGLILRTTEEINFDGYTLAKDLLLLPNIYHIHLDPNVWGDPENFRPERFLENGFRADDKKNPLKEYMVAFQPGKRICPGEQVARDTLFLYSVKLLARFTFSPEKGRERSEYMEQKFSYVQIPKKIGVVITSRESRVSN